MLVPDTPSARCQRPLGVPRVLHITPRLWSLPPGEKCHGLAILPAAVFPCSFLHAAQRLKERGRPAAPRVLLLLLPPPAGRSPLPGTASSISSFPSGSGGSAGCDCCAKPRS